MYIQPAGPAGLRACLPAGPACLPAGPACLPAGGKYNQDEGARGGNPKIPAKL